MVHSNSDCLLLSLYVGFDSLVSNGFLNNCNFLNSSCLFGHFLLRMSLLIWLSVDLLSDLNSLLLMNLFMWLKHFNIVKLILVRFLLWEVLNYCQSDVLVVFVKLCTTSQVGFCINNVISICVYLLTLLQLNMSVANWWFFLMMSLCKVSYVDRVAHWYRCLLRYIGTCKAK